MYCDTLLQQCDMSAMALKAVASHGKQILIAESPLSLCVALLFRLCVFALAGTSRKGAVTEFACRQCMC